MIKVLHFYKRFSPYAFGGVDMTIKQLCHASRPLKISHSILSLSSNPTNKIETNDYVSYQAKEHLNFASNPISFSILNKFRELAENVDIIHYHFPWPFMDMIHLFSGIKKPTIVTYHSDIVRQKFLMQLYKPLMHCFLNNVDQIVATSPNYLNSSPVLQRYKNKTTVIPIGLDKNSYLKPTTNALKKWQEKLSHPFFLFVGVLRYYKGLHILLEAVKNSNMPIIIVGEGPAENKLKRKAQQLNLKNVTFLGALSEEDKIALLTLCHAFVFPSNLRSEAFGISLLEAAMLGKPMISCEISTGTSYINVNNETGFVVPPNNPDKLQKAMQDLYDNQVLAKKMGVNAQRRYEDIFTADKMAKAYLEVYQKLLVTQL